VGTSAFTGLGSSGRQGTVDAAPRASGLAHPGQEKVVAMMGDMGGTYDGGYAEYTAVPAVPGSSRWTQTCPGGEVDGGPAGNWGRTAYGSLTIGMDLKPGKSVLIPAGTSSVGLAAAARLDGAAPRVDVHHTRTRPLALLASQRGRQPAVDTGEGRAAVRRAVPGWRDARRDLVRHADPAPDISACGACCTGRPAQRKPSTSGRCGTSLRTRYLPRGSGAHGGIL